MEIGYFLKVYYGTEFKVMLLLIAWNFVCRCILMRSKAEAGLRSDLLSKLFCDCCDWS